jgi:hypothetical protein
MDKKLIVLIGAAVTIVGLFLPIVSVPIVGSVNMLLPGGGIGDGIFVLVFVVIAAVLALLGKTRHAVWPAIAALGFIGYKFFELKGAVDRSMATLSSNPEAAQYLESIGGGVQINWLGWIVLGLGALVMLVGGAMAWKSNPPAA